MKNLISLLLLLSLLIGCSDDLPEPSSDQLAQKQTEEILQESSRQVGMPAIVNFQEKKNLKWIYELCDQEDLLCHAYLFNEIKGEIGQYLGECIGYGIPYSTQFSNPEKVWMESRYGSTGSYNDIGGTIPQPEPNGLFKPEGLSATWLIMIDPKTKKPRPVYIEPLIIVSPFKLK